MSSLRLSLADGVPGVTGTNLTWVIAVAIVALLALVVAGVLELQDQPYLKLKQLLWEPTLLPILEVPVVLLEQELRAVVVVMGVSIWII